jgi:uncharacterized membrane protein YfcA
MDANSALLAAVIFAFVIAFIFSMFGQGGGSVYSPLLLLLGYSILLSTSTSLVLNLITSLSAGYIFYRKGMIDYKTSLIFAPGISLGAFAGGALSKSFDTTVLLWVFVVFLLGVGARMIGGGIFVVPFMVYVYKVPTKIAAGSSHLIISFSALAGIIGHATTHHFDIPLIVVTGIAVLIGGNLGARVSMKVNTKMIKAGLGLIMWAFGAQILVTLVR